MRRGTLAIHLPRTSGQSVAQVLAIADRSAVVDPLQGVWSEDNPNNWNQSEMIRLNMAVKLKGEDDWEKVAGIVSTGSRPRTAAECSDAWERNMDQYTSGGAGVDPQWIGYTSSDMPPPDADTLTLQSMVKNVEGQLAKDPTNNDLRELHQNMQKMLHQSTFEDPRTPPKERALGAARAVAPSPAEAAHEWAEQEKIRASFEQAPEPEDEESPAPTASARKEEKQTRSELIHAALARDCTHKMGPAEKNVSALSAIPSSIGCLRALRAVGCRAGCV